MLQQSRPSSPFAFSGPAGRRPGRVSALLVLSLPTLTLIVSLALNAGTLTEVRTWLLNSADSSALAGAQALVDDRWLLGDPSAMLAVLAEARAQAQDYVERNPVPGGPEPVRLRDNPNNDRDGDMIFASLAKPRDRDLVVPPLGANLDPDALPFINTVRVTVQRTRQRGNPTSLLLFPGMALTETDITTAATATLDGWVVGLRPTAGTPTPLAPIALLSDPAGANPDSWQRQVEHKQGRDDFRVARVNKRPVIAAGPDGLHEMAVRLVPQGSTTPPNACLLQLGVNDAEGLAGQLTGGVKKEHLDGVPELGGEFVLPEPANARSVPGTPWVPSDAGERGRLQTALQQLQSSGEPRVWPLFSHIDSAGMPVITGFVAARVAQVTGASSGPLSFVLQPCRMSSGTVVTDPSRQGFAGGPLGNPYVCRVRLVD